MNELRPMPRYAKNKNASCTLDIFAKFVMYSPKTNANSMKNTIEHAKKSSWTENALFIFSVLFSSSFAYTIKGVWDEAINALVKKKTIIMLKEYDPKPSGDNIFAIAKGTKKAITWPNIFKKLKLKNVLDWINAPI